VAQTMRFGYLRVATDCRSEPQPMIIAMHAHAGRPDRAVRG
jgi:hypothetical protein